MESVGANACGIGIETNLSRDKFSGSKSSSIKKTTIIVIIWNGNSLNSIEFTCTEVIFLGLRRMMLFLSG